MKKLFLFDMDGTLTPPRKKMTHDVLDSIAKLQKNCWDIGIISGSDMDYIEHQCDIMFDLSPVNCRSVHFLPCNGTKYYKNFNKVWEYSMVSELGHDTMNDLMKVLLFAQQNIISLYTDIPLTGNFIQVRGSVLNWCPIGRNANNAQREKWVLLDKKIGIREHYLQRIKEKINLDRITIKLGGDTSFDIYPKGWNKTFPIEKIPFTAYDSIYFAGDRCIPNGNDEELYNYLNKKEKCKGFKVSGIKDTINVIKSVLRG